MSLKDEIRLCDEDVDYYIKLPLPEDHWIFSYNKITKPITFPHPEAYSIFIDIIRSAAKFSIAYATKYGTCNIDPDMALKVLEAYLCGGIGKLIDEYKLEQSILEYKYEKKDQKL